MKELNLALLTTVLFSCHAQAANLPTLCLGGEINDSFSDGIAITLNPASDAKFNAEVYWINLYGYHLKSTTVIGKAEDLELSSHESDTLVFDSPSLRLTLRKTEDASHWEGTADSLIAPIGGTHLLRCWIGSLQGNMRRYMPR